ncbi:hypothetical protein G5V59_00305 [Nocardioides sp. W3-2-3]|uniref:hypothetical protein n=1 Tax=Nocardioides convexus TaxID=2712224 RepID=UPI0024186F45|nr:hypothetical protein [Nocardioides convexus]NGZ99413.1 hypothetical protein [Nocardioides convexus]
MIHHRAKGRDTAFIRCEGTHPCECRDQWCACHLHPVRHRHEWANSGRASKNWQTLAREQDHRKDQELLETKALDAVARALTLHAETTVYPWADDCPTPAEHAPAFQEPIGPDGDPVMNVGLICTKCIPISTVCVHCRDDAGDYHPYPCPTAQALDLEQTTTPTQE